jgi:hypothetical protein
MIPLFANPLMLWGLAAASVPIVIHLLNRRRFRTQRWAAMEWLLAAAKKNQKRLRMENLLLLLLRTCAVLFLALALARPTFSDTRLAIDKQAAHLFILLDDSASMGARTGTGTVLEMATNAASQLIGEIGADDPVTLVLTNDTTDNGTSRKSGRPRVVLRGTHDHPKVRQVIGDLKPAAARADLVESLKVLEEAVPNRGAVVPKVAILTDLQRAAFEGADAAAGASPDAAVRATLERLRDKGADVVLMPFGRVTPNVAVTSLGAQDDRDVVQGAPAVFEAEVRNFGDHAVKVEVRFLVDGKERGEVSQHVSLPARPAGAETPPTATAQFATKFADDETGVHVIEARIAADGLPADDARSFAFEVRRPIRVLAVDGDPRPAEGLTPETHRLRDALAIKPGGPIVVQVVDEADFEAETDLAKWDMVVLANVEHPARTEASRRRLESYVRSGGALLFTVGDRVVPDVWNQEVWGDGTGLLPARLGKPAVDKASPVRFDLTTANRHPILKDITNPASAALFNSPLVWGRLLPAEDASPKGSRVVLTYSDRVKDVKPPALIERALGRGRTLLLTTTVDDAWTKLPGDHLFPVLLHEIVYYMTSHGNAGRNVFAFQTYTRSLPPNVGDAVEVIQPDGSPAKSPEIDPPVDGLPTLAYTETSQLGAYRITIPLKPADILAAAPAPLADAFTASLPAAESDLARLRPEEVSARWPGLLRVATSFESTAEAVRPKGGEIHAAFLIASLACLLGEVLLVRRIARSRAVAA